MVDVLVPLIGHIRKHADKIMSNHSMDVLQNLSLSRAIQLVLIEALALLPWWSERNATVAGSHAVQSQSGVIINSPHAADNWSLLHMRTLPLSGRMPGTLEQRRC